MTSSITMTRTTCCTRIKAVYGRKPACFSHNYFVLIKDKTAECLITPRLLSGTTKRALKSGNVALRQSCEHEALHGFDPFHSVPFPTMPTRPYLVLSLEITVIGMSSKATAAYSQYQSSDASSEHSYIYKYAAKAYPQNITMESRQRKNREQEVSGIGVASSVFDFHHGPAHPRLHSGNSTVSYSAVQCCFLLHSVVL